MSRQLTRVTVAKVRNKKKPRVEQRPVSNALARAQANPSKGRKPSAKRAAAKNVSALHSPVFKGSAFPVVGIGSSAGGLEALELFLRSVPNHCGMAYVIVQHMDPTRKGMLVDLLARATPMKVYQAKDGMKVEPDCIYVIPPAKDLSIEQGVLHLLTPALPRGLRLPIDTFFRSLANDRRNGSIGVILSGMGSDGTQGLAAIKEQGGAGFVQEPASAKFDAMPLSAIDAGLADVVAPAEELARKIVAYRDRISKTPESELSIAAKTQSAIDQICVLLRSQTGSDFSQYKRSTVYRRIERRMSLHQISNIASYVRLLQESPQETLLLSKELLIGVTSFFRDSADWEFLKKKALPALLSQRTLGGTLRAWVPGCSTGEEAYSLAIVFKEVLAQLRPAKPLSLQIFATDLDKDSIDRARQGYYSSNVEGDVSAERLRRFFAQEGPGYRVIQELRETVIFAVQNVVMDPPFTKLDILSCRNLLIYLTPGLQNKLVPLFHYCLNPGGLLILGCAETLGPAALLFAPLGGKTRIFRRLEVALWTEQPEFPASFHARVPPVEMPNLPKAQTPNLQILSQQFLLERYSPAAVLTNEQGDILYVCGRTGKYLEPAAGKANWNIHAMARDELRYELSAAFQKALRVGRTVLKTRVNTGNKGESQAVDVTVEPIQEPAVMCGMVMVVFADVESAPAEIQRTAKGKPVPALVAKLDKELQQAQEEVRTTRQEMQASQEELKSANEELQSANEELQSTNEELTTSKEEMQSMNEELQTLNHELQAKVDELSRASDDMRNLLDSTDIATLFLDDALTVRRFTAQMTKLIKLIPGDVKRPITDLASTLIYPELEADARAVLKTLVFKEKPVHTLDGRWFTVRIMPYRTLDNRIDGVVITFVDITTAKDLEASLRQRQVTQ